ncbi:MAG: hypothetical protein ACXWUH_15185 [Burkholderiales bacterium]
MRKLGAIVLTAALAGTAWAQAGSQGGERKSGVQSAPGVVTGGDAQTGIALRSDAAKANASVPVVSGGVSLNARDNMRAQTPPHNVKMVFSLNTGNYVSDVGVKVTDKAGKVVIDDVSNGPWLYAQLPQGSYTATATYAGRSVTQRFSVGKSGTKTAHFRWPASVEQAEVGASSAEGGGQILGTGPQELQEQR